MKAFDLNRYFDGNTNYNHSQVHGYSNADGTASVANLQSLIAADTAKINQLNSDIQTLQNGINWATAFNSWAASTKTVPGKGDQNKPINQLSAGELASSDLQNYINAGAPATITPANIPTNFANQIASKQAQIASTNTDLTNNIALLTQAEGAEALTDPTVIAANAAAQVAVTQATASASSTSTWLWIGGAAILIGIIGFVIFKDEKHAAAPAAS